MKMRSKYFIILLFFTSCFNNSQNKINKKKSTKSKYNKTLDFPHVPYTYERLDLAKRYFKLSKMITLNTKDNKVIERTVSGILKLQSLFPHYLHYYFSRKQKYYTCNDLREGIINTFNDNLINALGQMSYCLEVNCKSYNVDIDKNCLNYYFSFSPARIDYYPFVPSHYDTPDGWDGLSLNDFTHDIRKYRETLNNNSFLQYFEKHINIYLKRIDRAIKKSDIEGDIYYLKSVTKELRDILRICNSKSCNTKHILLL